MSQTQSAKADSLLAMHKAPPLLVLPNAWDAATARVFEKAGARAIFQVAVAENLPFPERRFDVVFSTLMLHHLPRKTRQQCAGEIERVLEIGGRVVAVDFGRAKRRGLLAHFHRHGHVEVEDIVNLFVAARLKPTRMGPVGMNDLNFDVASSLTSTSGSPT